MKTKFKVGDRVKLVNSGYSFDGATGTIKQLGFTIAYVVLDESQPNTYENYEWSVDFDSLKLVNECHNFKIGDIVKVIKTSFESGRELDTLLIGNTGTITDTDCNLYGKHNIEVSFFDENVAHLEPNQLELLKPRAFKIGDRVKILPTKHVKSWSLGEIAIGRIVTITKEDVSCLENCGNYHLNDNEFCINFKPSDLELVQESEPEIVKESFKAGDEIIMLKSCPGSESKGEITRLVEAHGGLLRTERYCMHDEYWKKVEPKYRKEETMKVGDKVELFRKDDCSRVKEGSIGTVEGEFDSETLNVKFDLGSQIIHTKNLRKVDSMKLKVGDRVESKQRGEEYTGVINSIDDDEAHILRDDTGYSWSCRIVKGKIATANGVWDKKSYLTKIGESMKFIVVDEDDNAEVFSSKEKAQEKVQELVEDYDQDGDCIEVYQVAKEFEVKKSGVKLVEKE